MLLRWTIWLNCLDQSTLFKTIMTTLVAVLPQFSNILRIHALKLQLQQLWKSFILFKHCSEIYILLYLRVQPLRKFIWSLNNIMHLPSHHFSSVAPTYTDVENKSGIRLKVCGRGYRYQLHKTSSNSTWIGCLSLASRGVERSVKARIDCQECSLPCSLMSLCLDPKHGTETFQWDLGF